MPGVKNGGFTPADLQLLLNADLEKTLADVPLLKTNGESAKIKAYSQELPQPISNDDEDELDAIPYVITKIQTGEKDDNSHIITVGIVICIHNLDHNRSGHFDLLNIIARLESRFGKNSRLGNFDVLPNFSYALQDSDTHPYYYAGIILNFNAQKTIKEDNFYT